MLYGELEDFKGELSNCKALKAAVAFCLKASSLGDGRHQLENGMYADIKRYSPKPEAERSYEAHVKYVDVQCVFEGSELIQVSPFSPGMKVKEAHPERDLTFYEDPGKANEVPAVLRPGFFLVLFPRDAHKTECRFDADNARKVIVKVPVELMPWR